MSSVTFYNRIKDLLKDIESKEGDPAHLSTNPIYLEGMGEDIIPIKFEDVSHPVIKPKTSKKTQPINKALLMPLDLFL